MITRLLAGGLCALCAAPLLCSIQIPVLHGHAKGTVDLPGPFAGGELDAVLLGPDGAPKFELDALLTLVEGPGLPLGKHGKVLGTLEAAGPLGVDVANVVGSWKAGPAGKGTLELEFVSDGPGLPKDIGGLKGWFGDAQPLPGKLHALWVLEPQG
jgi:hypothetical protein